MKIAEHSNAVIGIPISYYSMLYDNRLCVIKG